MGVLLGVRFHPSLPEVSRPKITISQPGYVGRGEGKAGQQYKGVFGPSPFPALSHLGGGVQRCCSVRSDQANLVCTERGSLSFSQLGRK